MEKIDEVMSTLNTMKDELQKDREAFEAEKRALEQEKAAFNAAPSVKREKEIGATLRDVMTAMTEKRAITLSGTGSVVVMNELAKVLANNTDILTGTRVFYGPNANTVIPVLNPRPAYPARQAEGASSIASDSTAALGVTELKPETYVAILPVSFEALKYSAANLESELLTVIAEAYREKMAEMMVVGRDKATYYEFLGIFNSAPEANQIQTAAEGAPTMKDLVTLALTMRNKVMTAPVIVMNPALYAGITAADVKGYDVYKNELIMNKTIEGVRIELCGKAPVDTTQGKTVAVGFDKKNYAIGIASDLTIEPLKKPGDTNTYFQAVMGMDGRPIVKANVYSLIVKKNV